MTKSQERAVERLVELLDTITGGARCCHYGTEMSSDGCVWLHWTRTAVHSTTEGRVRIGKRGGMVTVDRHGNVGNTIRGYHAIDIVKAEDLYRW